MRVDQFFEHMEKVVHGTKFVPLENERQFVKPFVNHGKGIACPKCKVGFHVSKKSTKEFTCPCCGHEWKIQGESLRKEEGK